MIKSLVLTNFRSHKDTELEFSPQVNVIVGESDNGKSNIIRALNWIATNRPLGENIIYYGEDQTVVQVVVEDEGEQTGITRVKTRNGENKYILSVKEKDISFKAFGSNPPEPILEVLNLSDITIQKQKEQYFLVFDSPGQVAVYVRSITKLDEVDKVVKLLGSKIRAKSGEISGCQEQLKEIAERLEEISKINLDEFKEKLEKAHSLISVVKQLQIEQNELRTLAVELERIEKNIIQLPDDVDQIIEYCSSITSAFTDLQERKYFLEKLLDDLKSIQSIQLPENTSKILDFSTEVRKYNNVCEELKVLTSILEKLETSEERIFNLSCQLQSLENEKLNLMNQLSVCPYCGSELSEERKLYLIKDRVDVSES